MYLYVHYLTLKIINHFLKQLAFQSYHYFIIHNYSNSFLQLAEAIINISYVFLS